MMDDLLQEMINPAPAPRDGARRRRLWTTVVIVGLAAIGATTLTTSAIFTDNDATSAAIHTGSVDLVVGQTTPFAIIPEGLAPGSSTFVPLTVSNTGSLELRYSISYYGDQVTGTADLSDVLELRMYAVPDTACNLDGTNAATTINNGEVEVTDWPTTATPLVGDPTTGPDLAENDRTIAGANNSEPLCARIDFPIESGNEYQNTGVTLNLVFDAEQTLNNP